MRIRFLKINKRYNKDIVKDSIILGVKKNISNKTLFYCISFLNICGYKNIYVYLRDGNTDKVNSAFDIIDKKKIDKFPLLFVSKAEELKQNTKDAIGWLVSIK